MKELCFEALQTLLDAGVLTAEQHADLSGKVEIGVPDDPVPEDESPTVDCQDQTFPVQRCMEWLRTFLKTPQPSPVIYRRAVDEGFGFYTLQTAMATMGPNGMRSEMDYKKIGGMYYAGLGKADTWPALEAANVERN